MYEESKIPTAVLKEFLRIALQSAPTLLVLLSFDKADSEIRLSNKQTFVSGNDFITKLLVLLRFQSLPLTCLHSAAGNIRRFSLKHM